jgi:RNA polymerase sigma-70 factor (ECF subfamily)
MVDLDTVSIHRAAKGDQKAFKRLYDHYAPFVWRVVYRTVNGDSPAAQEIVQETFIRVFRSLKSFAGESSAGTWIYRIALNAANDFLAKRLRYREMVSPLLEELPGNLPGPEAYDTSEMVAKILERLPPEDRFLLVAKEVDGLSFEELAAICGKTSEALRTRMSRLKDRLHAMFKSRPVFKEAVV